MKTVLSLTDAGGDKLRIEVPEEKDMMFVACGAVCNVRIGKCEFAPDAMQLKRIVCVLRRVADGANSVNDESGARVSDAPEWQCTGGAMWLSIGAFRIVLRLELDGGCTGWIDRNYTQITDAQTFDTWEVGKTVMAQLLRDYIAKEISELNQVVALIGGVK